MWYFVPEEGLGTDAEYDLSIAIDEEPEEVSSTTNMIAEQIGNITQPPRVNNFKIGFAVGFDDLSGHHLQVVIDRRGGRYDVTVFIHVIERI